MAHELFRCVACGGENEDRLMLGHPKGCLFWKAYDAIDALASRLDSDDRTAGDGEVVGNLRNALERLLVRKGR